MRKPSALSHVRWSLAAFTLLAVAACGGCTGDAGSGSTDVAGAPEAGSDGSDAAAGWTDRTADPPRRI